MKKNNKNLLAIKLLTHNNKCLEVEQKIPSQNINILIEDIWKSHYQWTSSNFKFKKESAKY